MPHETPRPAPDRSRAARALPEEELEIAAAKRTLRAHGWYVRYTEWPSGHQVVLHLRSDTAIHLVTPWCPAELEAWRQALSEAAQHGARAEAQRTAGGESPTAPRGDDGGDGSAQAGPDRDVVVIGAAGAEVVVHVPRPPRAGEVVAGDGLAHGPGGRGAVQALAAARLGARVALVARVGADRYGDDLVARLRSEGVDVEHVIRDPDAATRVAVLHLDRRGRRSGAVVGDDVSLDDLHRAGGALGRCAVVVASLELPIPCVLEAFRIARRHGAQGLLDATPARKVSERLLAAVDVVRVDARGAEVLTGTRVHGRESAVEAARALLRRGPGAVVVDADAGDLLLTRGEVVWISEPPVMAVDRDLARDAFCGALAAGLAEGRALADAGRLARATAAIAGARFGGAAALPTRDEVSRSVEASHAEELVLDGLVPGDATVEPARRDERREDRDERPAP